ncbi:MAG: hypothetical protein KME52_00480 [Desmonostoc geniculatum HA4340-LM1]|nr:hypothetical protein [Desmonostoc geniculatum HA4340-LM1]
MSYLRKLSVSIAGAALIALGTGQIAQAELFAESESAVVNLDTQEVLFTINFNRVPDFLSVDEYNTQADSFQYFIDPDGELPIFGISPAYSNLKSIIRGEEIHVGGDVRIRDVFPVGSSEPNSGGWGSIRGSVPYTLDGTLLKFSAPLQFIGDSDGLFSYALELYEFGSWNGITNENKSIVTSVPEPNCVLGALTCGVLSLGLRLKRKHKSVVA